MHYVYRNYVVHFILICFLLLVVLDDKIVFINLTSFDFYNQVKTFLILFFNLTLLINFVVKSTKVQQGGKENVSKECLVKLLCSQLQS